VTDILLDIQELSKRFDGLVASDAISLAARQGERHALIGPNGAGKTTLIGQLAGEILADSGSIRFAGRDITALPIHGRSALGLARTFQITSLFPEFTALDNVALADQAYARHSYRCWRDARDDPRLRVPAREALGQVGLDGRADAFTSNLGHGEHRRLEIAMALATQPRMLLLDEPLAGMGSSESRRMVATLQELKRRLTILLVEHDLECVFRARKASVSRHVGPRFHTRLVQCS
jgi:branched-chain amino acid transport system ATP-binding protein